MADYAPVYGRVTDFLGLGDPDTADCRSELVLFEMAAEDIDESRT